jgi:hypothetical protein
VDPTGPASGSFRVVRGGSWGAVATYCRVACRGYYSPGDSYSNFGFRCARSSVDASTLTPYANWQGTKFTAADTLTGLTTMAAYFDNDGMPNLLEYAFGTDPKSPTTSPLTVSVSGNNLQFSFPCDDSRTDISYAVQASADLSTWTDIAQSTGGTNTQPVSNLSAVLDAGTGARTVWVMDSTAIPAGGKRFLRLKIVSLAQ